MATITRRGLATSAEMGSDDDQATSGTVAGTTTLTVTAPTLVSIAVTPAKSIDRKGNTQQFTATGTYTDGSTQNLTSTATWSSATATVATISAAGLATSARNWERRRSARHRERWRVDDADGDGARRWYRSR